MMTKTQRQAVSQEKWRQARGIGTIEGCTGFGKTRIGTNVCKLMQLKKAGTRFIIVVPTTPLYKQWNKILTDLGIVNFKVYTIQSLINETDVLLTDLLILDEIHLYAADTFYQVFDIIKYKFILGLTATLERLDSKHTLLEEHCPIVDSIPLTEAKRNGWVSDFVEYNLYIDLSKEDRETYNKMNKWLNNSFSYFDHDFNLMRACCTKYNKYYNGKQHLGAEHYVKQRDFIIYDDLNNRLLGDSLLDAVVKHANICKRLIQQRQDFINKHPIKAKIAIEILKTLDKKAITFSANSSTADIINEAMGDLSASYHSNIESVTKTIRKIKNYKRPKAAQKFADSKPNGEVVYDEDNDSYNVLYDKEERIGVKRLKESIIENFCKDNLKYLHSCKALDVGLDAPGIELLIILAGDSNSARQIQRIGRAIRIEGDKIAIIINLILRNTQDEKWARRRQVKNARYIRHIDNINEIT